jgi:hypothetical protein
MAGHAPSGMDFFGGDSPTPRLALKWLRTRTLHEFGHTLDEYTDKIRSAVLYGTQETMHPLQVASLMYHATHKAEVNWRMLARTEMIRRREPPTARLRITECCSSGGAQIPDHLRTA